MEIEQDTTKCLGKLARCYNTLQYVRTRLDSYLYEPSTMALFESKVYLKDKIKNLATTNENLTYFLKASSEVLPDHYKMVKNHIKETFDLEVDVLKYTAKFRHAV